VAVFDSIVRKAKLPESVDLYVYPSSSGTEGLPVYMRGAASSRELELTESVLMEATQRHSNTLERLRQLGTKITIDDFGTGYSSLKYLTTYSVQPAEAFA
jgi:EAL domain